MLKDAIKSYLDQYFNMWKEERDSLPMISLEEEDIMSDLFVGEEDEDGYIQWEYKPVEEIADFTELENKYSVKIAQEIKEYYNSYLFLMFGGVFEGESIYFDALDDNSYIVVQLDERFSRNVKDKIIIGHGKWDAPLCVKIDTGEVILWEHRMQPNERERVLAGSLEELFGNLKVNKFETEL